MALNQKVWFNYFWDTLYTYVYVSVEKYIEKENKLYIFLDFA